MKLKIRSLISMNYRNEILQSLAEVFKMIFFDWLFVFLFWMIEM